jgi:hypothetical protein
VPTPVYTDTEAALFTGVRRIGILGSSHVRSSSKFGAFLVLRRVLCHGAHTLTSLRSMLSSLRAQLRPREGTGPLPALLLDQGSLPFGYQAREEKQGLRLAKDPGMRGFVLLLLAGVMLCWLGILLSLPATAPQLPSAFAGTDAAQEVDGGANAPLQDGSYPITPAEEVREPDGHPANASLLTMLVLSLSFGASVLCMATNDRRRAASYFWGVDDSRWLVVAYEGPSFLGVFRL